MKNYYFEQSKLNLVPLSQDDDYEVAFTEWKPTGLVIFPIVNDVCELCTQKGLAAHFEIMNMFNGNKLLVGSSCIKRFKGIRVEDERGELLTGKARDKQLDNLLKAAKEDRMLQPLRDLWTIDKSNRSFIARYVDIYKDKGGFLSAHLAFLFGRMNDNDIAYDISLYKVYIRSDASKKIYWFGMEDKHRELIKSCLSEKQLASLEKYRLKNCN